MGKIKKQTEHAIILDLDCSEKQLKILSHLGLNSVQETSWKPENRNDKGLLEMFVETNAIGRDSKIFNALIIVEPEAEAEKLQDFFKTFTLNAYNYIEISHAQESSALSLVALNLFPFNICRSLADKISQGVYAALRDLPYEKNITFVILTVNINSFITSAIFQELLVNDIFSSNNLFVIDNNHKCILYTKNQIVGPTELSDESFLDALIQNDEQLYHSLIFETNTYLGHFDLGSSHVRTHYDLFDFVSRENVARTLISKIINFVKEFREVLILGVGLETATLSNIGMRLELDNSEHSINFRFLPLFGKQRQENDLTDEIKKYDFILILTDIVNSSDTIKGVAKTISKLNDTNVDFGYFSIVKMLNSESKVYGKEINFFLTIKRNSFILKTDTCVLCDLKQPKTKVESIGDFSKDLPIELTPLDFWELVEDTKAISSIDYDKRGRKLYYMIELSNILKNYRLWLSSVIANAFKCNWSIKPNAICTLKKESSIEFATFVARSLNINTENIVEIDPKLARSFTRTSSFLYDNIAIKPEWKNILLVDAGIISGQTINNLGEIIKKTQNSTTQGALVFYSRLDSYKMENIQHTIGGEIVSLYNWPSLPASLS